MMPCTAGAPTRSRHTSVSSRIVRAAGGATLLLATLAASATAQSVRWIQSGQALSGSLTSNDRHLTDNSYYQLFWYRGRAGERVTFTLRSRAFDAYFAVGTQPSGPGNQVADGFNALQRDDDGGGGTDSKIEVTLPNDGAYGLLVNTVAPQTTGDFTIAAFPTGGSEPTVSQAGGPMPMPGKPGNNTAPFPGGNAGSVRNIAMGQTVNGTISSSDPKLASDNTSYQLWWYQGHAREHITVTMRSGAFDAFVQVGMYSGQPTAQLELNDLSGADADDDGAGGTDAKVEYTVPRDGWVAIRANTVTAGEAGAYTLTVEGASTVAPAPRGKGAVAPQPPSGALRYIQSGQAIAGALTTSDPMFVDTTYYQMYWYQAQANETVTFVLRSSAFDAYLSIGRSADAPAMVVDGLDVLGNDDDSGGGTDAKVEVTFPSAGVYGIRVNTMNKNETGAYTLAAFRRGETEPKP